MEYGWEGDDTPGPVPQDGSQVDNVGHGVVVKTR